MNDYAQDFKNRFSGFGISSEDIAVFADVARRAAAITGVSVAELFESLAGLWRAIDKIFSVVKESVKSITELLEEIKDIDLPPPLSALQRLWKAQRQQAEREKLRVRLKYLAYLLFIRHYKPP